MENKRALLGDFAAILVLIGFALLIALPRYRAAIDWGDEGFLAYGAVRVMHGEIPHRDFVSLQPPLSFYTTALAFRLFGTSLQTLRGFGLAIFLALPMLIYGIARCLTRSLLSFIAAAPVCLLSLSLFNFTPFAVWQGILASLAAVLLFNWATLFNRTWVALFSGIFVALSFFLRHDQAFYLSLSIVVYTVCLFLAQDDTVSKKNLGRALRLWFGGMALVLLPLSIFWWIESALPQMYHQLIVFPATMYARTSSLPFPKIDFHQSPAKIVAPILFYIPPAVFLLAALWLGQRIIRGRFYRREAIFTFLLVWSALFYLQAVTRSDLNHLFITLPPFFILTAFCWHILMTSLGERSAVKIVSSLLAIAMVGIFLRLMSANSLPPLATAKEPIDLPTGGAYAENGAWLSEFMRGVQHYVPPQRPILVLPYQPMFYFLSERRNPTRWNYLWPGDQTPQDHAELVAQAKRDPPAVIFVTGEEEMAAYAPTILEYVHREYRKTGEFGRLRVYFPNDATP